MIADAGRCSARRKDGRPCRAWAVRDSEQALCASHLRQNRQAAEQTGFYDLGYTVDEATDLIYQAAERDLNAELGVTRAAVRRVLEQLSQDLEPSKYRRLIELLSDL